jgi:monoamine oxidase
VAEPPGLGGGLHTHVAIVGGGLCGLALASHLHCAGLGFQLFEARARPGGRIVALTGGGGRVDLGPSWFWPGQPRIAALADALGLTAFAQHDAGDGCFEDADGAVHRAPGLLSMQGALRLDGGMTGLVEGLVAGLPPARLHLARPVRAVTPGRVTLDDGSHCMAAHVVLALPPRLAAGLAFDPPLPSSVAGALGACPTWMAGHAKFVAIYDAPFWRGAGLSGDAASRRGPLAEIHDASGARGAPAALFGFAGVAAAQRIGQGAAFSAAALDQLGRIFGPWARSPLAFHLMDWSAEPHTATPADHLPPRGHPDYGPPPPLPDPWAGRLHLGGTETAAGMGGLLEGALASAEDIAARIIATAG